MKLNITATCRLAAVAALATTTSAQADVPITCVAGLHVIVARASGEPPGFGLLEPVKDQILERVPQSDAVWVPYPATIRDPPYTESQPAGVGNLTKLIVDYGDACPQGRMALMGYSQGGHVVGDALIGGNYERFPAFTNGTGLEQRYIDQIAAVIMMGEPANVAGVDSILVGNSTRDGFFPRNNTDRWEETGLVGKTQSYCDAEDTFCDSGTLGNVSLAIHIGYIPVYGDAAADYVVARAPRSGNGGNGTNNATATSTPPPIQTTSGGDKSTARYAGSAVLAVMALALAAALQG